VAGGLWRDRLFALFSFGAISKTGFPAEIKARPRLNPQATVRVVEDLMRGLNAISVEKTVSRLPLFLLVRIPGGYSEACRIGI
jgi:hypothetical protein